MKQAILNLMVKFKKRLNHTAIVESNDKGGGNIQVNFGRWRKYTVPFDDEAELRDILKFWVPEKD